jgi:hypothetical protein
MGALNPAMGQGDGPGGHALDPQHLQPDGDAADVNQCVHTAQLMEVDRLQVCAMDRCLGFTDTAKDRKRTLCS